MERTKGHIRMSHPTISPEEFAREVRDGERVTVIDLRDPASFDAWHVTGERVDVRNITPTEISAAPDAVARAVGDQPVRVVCARGRTAFSMAGVLREHGADASVVEDGMMGWARVLVHDEIPMPTGTAVIQFRREARGCLSYLVVSGADALVVDPAPHVAPYVEEADRRGATIRWVVDTHLHADHLSGARALARHRRARYVWSAGARARGIADTEAGDDGASLPVGDADIRLVGLPGHTSDNMGVLVDGVALIAGDSLFADAVARPDLEVGDDGAERAARILYATIRDRILSLPAQTRLLPCHYPGGMLDGPIAPTLAEVRTALPLLAMDEDTFTRTVIAAMGDRPANYVEIIAANRDGADEESAGLELGANNCAAG